MTGENYHPPGYEHGSLGSVTVDILFEEVGGRLFHWTAECGLVEEVATVRELGDGLLRADHVVNLVDDGTLFVLSRPFVDLRSIARRFYRYFFDDYDFLVVRSALPRESFLLETENMPCLETPRTHPGTGPTRCSNST